jgi:RHH-type rel operon transcriptional repressor/antitoxin RelB
LITLRLEPNLEHNLQHTANILGITEYISQVSKPTPWELGKNYFGKYSSGKGNLSKDRKELLKLKLRDKSRTGR